MAAALSYFNQPKGVTVDGTGVVYIADTGNAAIRKLQVDATVTSLSLSEASTGTGGTGTTGGTASPSTSSPAPASSGGGGGGSVGVVFAGLLLGLSAARALARRKGNGD